MWGIGTTILTHGSPERIRSFPGVAVAAVIARTGAAEVDWIGTSLGGHIGMEIAALARRADPPPGAQRLRRAHRRSGAAAHRRLSADRATSTTSTSSRRTCAPSTRRSATSPTRNGGTWPCTAWCRTEDGDYRQHFDPAIARAFSWPLIVDVALWHVWEQVACPVLILRGEDSDLLLASTVATWRSAARRPAEGLGAHGRGARMRSRAGADERRADLARGGVPPERASQGQGPPVGATR